VAAALGSLGPVAGLGWIGTLHVLWQTPVSVVCCCCSELRHSAVAIALVELCRWRLMSLLAVGKTAQQFRITFWMAFLQMISGTAPWLGHRPGNNGLQPDLPLYRQPKVQLPSGLFISWNWPCEGCRGLCRKDLGLSGAVSAAA